MKLINLLILLEQLGKFTKNEKVLSNENVNRLIKKRQKVCNTF